MNLILSTLRTVIKAYPAIVPHLKGQARWVAYSLGNEPIFKELHGIRWNVPELIRLSGDSKTYDFFLSTLERLVQSVYSGSLSGEFIDIMANLISGQLTQAYEQAWAEEGDESAFPDYLTASLEDMILGEFDHVDAYFKEIVDARIDETPIDPLLARTALWANRYNEAYNEAARLIALENGEKLEWIEGDTFDKCESCVALDGIVAYAWMWEELGVKPQAPPNENLVCGGWKCGCGLVQTDKRATRGARERILAAIAKK